MVCVYVCLPTSNLIPLYLKITGLAGPTTRRQGWRKSSNIWWNKDLFRSKFFLDFNTVVFSFLFNKYYLIMEQLCLKDLSRDLQINCVISYFLSIFNVPCICRKIRYDGESCKVLSFWSKQCPLALVASSSLPHPSWLKIDLLTLHISTWISCN
jgi:hypothetical protein